MRSLGVVLNKNFLSVFGEKLREFLSFFSLKFRAEKLKLEFSPHFKPNSFYFKSNPQKNSKSLNFLEFFEIFMAENSQNFYNFYQKRLGYA